MYMCAYVCIWTCVYMYMCICAYIYNKDWTDVIGLNYECTLSQVSTLPEMNLHVARTYNPNDKNTSTSKPYGGIVRVGWGVGD